MLYREAARKHSKPLACEQPNVETLRTPGRKRRIRWRQLQRELNEGRPRQRVKTGGS